MTKTPAPDPQNLAIGQRMRWARELIYDSQAEFARAMGLNTSTLNKLEMGKRTLSLVNLKNASRKLRCGPEYLLWGDVWQVELELRVKLIKLHPELMSTGLPEDNRHEDPAPRNSPLTWRGGTGTGCDLSGGMAAGSVSPSRKPAQTR